MDPSTPSSALSKVADLVVAAAAATGAVVAVLGLSAWKRQLKGEAEYGLAKRILRLCYQYRDALTSVRNPLMMSYEMPPPPEDEPVRMNAEQRLHYGRQRGYEARWKKVSSVRSDLYPELLEAEVLWDQQLTEMMNPLFKLERDLLFAIQDMLEAADPNVSRDDKEHLLEPGMAKSRRAIVFSSSSKEDDFSDQFQEGLDKIAEFLKARLKK